MASVSEKQELKKELETYERHKQELLSESEGKYVLIHGDEIAGIWDTYEDTLKAGYDQFALEHFLVKRIQRIEDIQFFARDILTCPY